MEVKSRSFQSPSSFAFIFPLASGHINPSLAIARSLVREGHQVHYLCREQMREVVEDTGAVYHNDIEAQPELYEGRDPSMWGALGSLQEEYSMKGESHTRARMKLRELAVELMLPGTLRWLRKIKAQAVLCCPMINLEGPVAAKVAGIPCAALLTVAGPGGYQGAWSNILLKSLNTTAEEIFKERCQFQGLLDCLARLEKTYGLNLAVEDGVKPMGVLRSCQLSAVTLVTTAEFLADPMSPEVSDAYGEHDFVYLGPLLDKPGAKRAGGHKFDAADHAADHDMTALNLARDARAEGRPVILVSLGTIITGDHEDYGWNAHCVVEGQKVGISGRELCQAAWQAAFDVFGSESTADSQLTLWCGCGSQGQPPLILVALGPQKDALEGLKVPPNAFCSSTLPQVDLLRIGVNVFLSHGGQNSFMEALSLGVPLVLCPGFGDQPVNAAKAESLQIGLKVDRPMRPLEHADLDIAAYRKATADALHSVSKNPNFKENAMRCAQSLGTSGGVSLATRVLLGLANSNLPRQVKLAGA